MRPLRLELRGFTAFRDDVEIDFEGLDLFAVCGQTGSGKSSILDAITYALYGSVPRFEGTKTPIGSLVSQGQPSMSVMLEFCVGDRHLRVTRRTPVKGATRILLERWEGGEWRPDGEGADRVREAEAKIEEAIGLDYEAFTRAVLLPQGKFAEFLVGDAKERREILTELLGLELFQRLGVRAGELKRDAESEAGARETLLEREYAGVSDGSVARAETATREAEEGERALAQGETAVRGIGERWATIERDLRELATCAADARVVASAARAAAEALAALAEDLAAAEGATAGGGRTAAARRKEAGRAERALAKAEADWGRLPALAALRAKAEALGERRDAAAEADEALDHARARVPAAAGEREAAEAAAAAAQEQRERARGAVREAAEAQETGRHADLVSTVRRGVRVGDPCPVCGGPIETLPKAKRAPDLARAARAVERAEMAAEAADRGLREAERLRERAAAAAEQAARDVERAQAEVRRRREELRALEEELRTAFGGRLPRDPAGTLDERIARIEELAEALDEARAAAAEADGAAVSAARAEEALRSKVREARAALEGLPVSGLVERARAAAGDDLGAPDLPLAAGLPDEPGTLGGAASTLAAGLDALADRLDEVTSRRGRGEKELLAEAEAAVGDLVASPGTLAGLVEAVAAARRTAAADSATAAKEVERQRERLEAAGRLMEEVVALRLRAGRFAALSGELRQDRIVAFLQLEALQMLASSSSSRLATLSAGRYRLAYEGDEFFVIDTWNGEESRSARTLSGGETFLASLALALALSEQVESLAVTRKAPLESLFLDEGFGTLDPETLETVVEAIEQLGGDGRMVGVITHVNELAMRLPVRIEVEKSPRGSRVTVMR